MKKAAFMARLWRGSPFLGGLISMREISTMAAMIVRKGEIELRICNGSSSLASLVLQASTMFPLSSDSFVFRLDVNALARKLLKFLKELNPNLRHGALLEEKPLWIYKMFNSDEICFLIGLNPNSLRLKLLSMFGVHLQLDPRELKLLPVKITLKSECFRKLLESFAPGPVEIFLFNDAVNWQQPSKKLEFNYRNSSECWSVGALEGRIRHLTVDFLQTKALVHASHVSKTAVIHTLADDIMVSWIMVLFPIDRKEFLVHLVRGLSRHDTAIEQKVSARSPDDRRRLMAHLH